MTETADARKKKRSAAAERRQAAQSYNPPYAAIVVDAKTGSVLHQASPDGIRHPASLTKIMTLYLLFERLESGKITLHTPLTVSETAARQPPTKLGLRAGGTLLVDDAIKALITKSANDAAVVVAEALAGSEEEFAKQMTRRARSLGMNHTTYRNASGLPNDNQVTTARDQALLGIAIQERFPKYYRYFSTSSFAYRGSTMQNHNKLLGKIEGVDGIKTGYTRSSGFNLISSVKRGYRQIVAVVLGGRSAASRDARMSELIGSTIKVASAKPSTLPVPSPVHAMASTDATTVATISVAENTATDSSGSDTPMKQVRVKTVTVKPYKPDDVVITPTTNEPSTTASSEVTPSSQPSIKTLTFTEVTGQRETASSNVESQNASTDKPTRTNISKGSAVASDKSKDNRSTEKPAVNRGGWAVQVGAYEAEGEAKQHLNSAKDKASLLTRAKAYVERTVKGTKTYYRARFAGFGRDEALAACKELKRKDIACVAVKI